MLLGNFLLPLLSKLSENRLHLSNPGKLDCVRFVLSLQKKSRIMADIKAEYLACPIRQVVSRFGDKWSMLVLYMLHTSERQRVGDQGSGMTGVLRFNEIRRLMTDCSQKMLSQTLKNLEQSHLVHRKVYPEVPPRVEYSLTETGKSLMPALTALIAWGKEHFNEVVTD